MKLTRMTVASATSVLLLGVLAGCGGTSPGATATDNTTPAAAGAPAGGGRTLTGMPGASGTIAAISGKTLQVQSDQAGQVAVTWSATTAITREADAALSDVAVGECVMVGADTATSGADTGAVAATSVRIADPVNGACTGGLGIGGPGGRPGGMPTDRPSNMPSGGTGGMRPGTSGKVTAVTATGFTVDAVQPVPPGSGTPSTNTSPVAVAVDGRTTYTKTVDATAADLKVGLCAMASGNADNTGSVSATRIGLSNPVNGTCGMGMRPGFGGAPVAGNGS